MSITIVAKEACEVVKTGVFYSVIKFQDRFYVASNGDGNFVFSHLSPNAKSANYLINRYRTWMK